MWMIPNRNPAYAVNEKGQIKSIAKNRVLSPKRNHDGYLRIQLWKNHKFAGYRWERW